MYLRNVYLLASAATVVGRASADGRLALTDILGEIPSCALGCLLKYIPPSACGTTNLTCVCTAIPLQSHLSICIQRSCTFTEQIKVAEVNDILCAGIPVDSRGWRVIIVGLVFGVLTLVTVLLRFYSRYLIAQGLWWDDWGILAALVLLIATVFVATSNCMLGYGKHFWNIDPTKIVALLKLFWSGELLYNATLTMTRISILLFYLRVFEVPWFRKLTIGSIIFAILSGLAFNFVILFQCRPLSGAWDWTVPRSQCLSLKAIAFANAGLSITQDVIILLMPIPNLLHLQMSGIKKLNLIFLFSLGALAVITSMIRLKFMITFGDSMDPTWDNIIPSMWSILEISIAMICTCLPSVRALLFRWFPTIFPSNTSPIHDNYRGHTGHSWDISRDIKLGSNAGDYSTQINSSVVNSVSKFNSRDDALRPSEEIARQAASDAENDGCRHVGAKRSDEIMFFHVSQDRVPLAKLDKNHIARQVVVSVNSSTFLPNSRASNGR